MRAVLTYPQGQIELPITPDRLVGVWNGPVGMSEDEFDAQLTEALVHPLDFPPLARAIVPGDQVLLAVGSEFPGLGRVIERVAATLVAAGIERSEIRVAHRDALPDRALGGLASVIHDPQARERLAYLATTAGGHRIYLNRGVTDADFVLPIGAIARTIGEGWIGPWSALFPGLSDDSASPVDAMEESLEVAWLVGNQFQVGVIPGTTGVARVVAGLANSVRDRGIALAEQAWTFRVERRADLAVLALGAGAGIEAAWSAFAAGAALVRRGGKVVVLSDAAGPIGPAARRLAGAESFSESASRLTGADSEPDYASAKGLADALSWADLYLMSRLAADDVEDIGLVPLSQPREVVRLAESAIDLTVMNHAEWTRGVVMEDEA